MLRDFYDVFHKDANLKRFHLLLTSSLFCGVFIPLETDIRLFYNVYTCTIVLYYRQQNFDECIANGEQSFICLSNW